jgi:acyl-CoA thioesterase
MRCAFSLADSALAFAANAHGRISVALECSISYPKSVNIGDVLFAEATELSLSNKIGIYNIHVSNQNGELVGVFKGSVYRTSKEWEV